MCRQHVAGRAIRPGEDIFSGRDSRPGMPAMRAGLPAGAACRHGRRAQPAGGEALILARVWRRGWCQMTWRKPPWGPEIVARPGRAAALQRAPGADRRAHSRCRSSAISGFLITHVLLSKPVYQRYGTFLKSRWVRITRSTPSLPGELGILASAHVHRHAWLGTSLPLHKLPP